MLLNENWNVASEILVALFLQIKTKAKLRVPGL